MKSSINNTVMAGLQDFEAAIQSVEYTKSMSHAMSSIQDETGKLQVENKRLKTENEHLFRENRSLKEGLEALALEREEMQMLVEENKSSTNVLAAQLESTQEDLKMAREEARDLEAKLQEVCLAFLVENICLF